MITTHTQLLNALIEKHNLRSYLEIGVQNPANNFDKINAPHKIGVDPEISERVVRNPGSSEYLAQCTSDDYFAGNHTYGNNEFGVVLPKIDLIFIDGDHTKEQIKKDFENALTCLSDNGFIVIHDVLPENEAGTLVPRIQRQWWGDVYKWAMQINQYTGIKWVTFNIDNGCMLVSKSNPGYSLTLDPAITYDWEGYLKHRNLCMNVINEVVI